LDRLSGVKPSRKLSTTLELPGIADDGDKGMPLLKPNQFMLPQSIKRTTAVLHQILALPSGVAQRYE